MKPVYMINGFLESGKTEFIRYTLSQPYFRIKGKTLLIVCEEGEEEYDLDFLKMTGTVMEVLEEESQFKPDYLLSLEKKHKAERIVIEYNGMWNFKDRKLPFHWKEEQQVTLIDAASFSLYFTNMRSLLAEMLRSSDMIIFNRCDGISELSSYKRNVKAINPNAEIVFEDAQGELNELMEEELPYDLQADPIPLMNPGFGIWYLDVLENIDRYIGKRIEFVGMVLKPSNFPKDYFVPGRMAMTCCADDMAFLGFACQWNNASKLKSKEWVRVIAEVKNEYWPDYQGEGPVLYALSVTPEREPEEPVISFM